MYGYLSKTKQSLALKLMAIYTLKSNILVYFSHLNYLLALSRFKSLYFHFWETAWAKFLPFYPKFSIKIRYRISLRFAFKLLFGTPSTLLSKTRLIRDIYLAIHYKLTCFGHRAHSTNLPHFGHIKCTYLLRKVTWPPINVIHKLSMSITQTKDYWREGKISHSMTW